MLAEQSYQRRTRVLKAMAHPSRLFILDALSRGEHGVRELQRFVRSDASTVSRHLSVMRLGGLVEGGKNGLLVWYTLRVPWLARQVLRFVDCVESKVRRDGPNQGTGTGSKRASRSSGSFFAAP